MISRRGERLTFWIGLILVGGGVWQLLPQRSADVWQNATYTPNAPGASSPPNYLAWGTLMLGFLTLASSNYFKWREDQRAQRAEQREVEAHQELGKKRDKRR